jgi:hypothetical protein
MSDRTTFVSFLLDETGSMQSIKDDTIGGLNEYLDALKKGGDDIVFSLVSFNSSETRRRYVAEPIGSVTPLEEGDYNPRHSTPLIDAAVKIIKATEDAVKDRGDDPNVVIVMQTDGLENVSVEYTNADLAALIKEKDQLGWQFLFLGAGLDAFAAARAAGIHIPAEQVISYGRTRSREVFRATADNLSSFSKSGDALSLSYSPAQREDVGDEYSGQYLEPGADTSKRTRSSQSQSGGRKGRRERSTTDDYDLRSR